MYTEAAFLSGIGPGELVLIFLVLLLVFGPRLPEVGRSLGIGIKEFKDGLKGEQPHPKSSADAPQTTSERQENEQHQTTERPG
ncbi:MAG TPA: twin-arginine translocase TatA/TatE family subunit [Planctomycetes bacterium]|nr:twin-arginine translocase TatA/TatE family subunit [Planctomycetota bacterium]